MGTAAVSSGQVTAITMTNAGSGFTGPPTVLIDPPNGLLIGQTNATLNLSAITTNNFGSYFVVITNFYGSITSSAATLTRAYPPGITNQPQSQFVGSGSAANFSVTSTGTPPFSFQWWMVSAQLTDATATPLVTNGFVLGATITKGVGAYLAAPTVQFVGGSGSGAGGTAVVSNRMVTAINITNAGSGYTTHPTIQIAAPTAIALTGQTASVLSLAAVTGTNAGNYYVVVTNCFGSVTSQVAMLTVELPGYNQITCQFLTNGSLRLSFVGLNGTNYALDRTFNLSPANWVPQATNHANAGAGVGVHQHSQQGHKQFLAHPKGALANNSSAQAGARDFRPDEPAAVSVLRHCFFQDHFGMRGRLRRFWRPQFNFNLTYQRIQI